LDGPARASQRRGDFPDRPAVGFELRGACCSFWRRRFRGFKVEGCGDLVSVLGGESAVPACAGIGFFGAEGERKAGQAGWASSASGDDQFVWLLPVVWVEEVGVHSVACGSAELAPEMPMVIVVYEVAKFVLAADEEVEGATHGVSSPALGRCSGRRIVSGELGSPCAPAVACLPGQNPVWRLARISTPDS
jgi:hypothetical protein